MPPRVVSSRERCCGGKRVSSCVVSKLLAIHSRRKIIRKREEKMGSLPDKLGEGCEEGTNLKCRPRRAAPITYQPIGWQGKN